MLSRLFRRRSRAERDLALDLTRQDWSPVPPSEVRTDWSAWLEEQPRPAPATRKEAASPRSLPTPEGPRQRRRTLPGDRRWREVLVALAEHLTEEELLIIKKQMAG